jgi:hypothetical protein
VKQVHSDATSATLVQSASPLKKVQTEVHKKFWFEAKEAALDLITEHRHKLRYLGFACEVPQKHQEDTSGGIIFLK